MSDAIPAILLAVVFLIGVEVFRWARRPEARRLRRLRKIGGPRPGKKWIVIGTSESTNFLRGDSGKRRWNVQTAPQRADLASADAQDGSWEIE